MRDAQILSDLPDSFIGRSQDKIVVVCQQGWNWWIFSKTGITVGTVLTTEVAVNFENFFEGVLAVN